MCQIVSDPGCHPVYFSLVLARLLAAGHLSQLSPGSRRTQIEAGPVLATQLPHNTGLRENPVPKKFVSFCS